MLLLGHTQALLLAHLHRTRGIITPLTGPSKWWAQALQSIAESHEQTLMSKQCHGLAWCLELSTSVCGGQGVVTSAYAAILLLLHWKPQIVSDRD